jgi:hypothetical protein
MKLQLLFFNIKNHNMKPKLILPEVCALPFVSGQADAQKKPP